MRTTFINNILQLCQNYDLDGVDIDWEFPTSSETGNFKTMLEQLRAAAPPGFLISAAIAVGEAYPVNAHPVMDWFFVMCYKDCPPQTTYDGAVDKMTSVVSDGVPASKLVMGCPIYGSDAVCETRAYSICIGSAKLDPSLDTYNGWSFNGPTTIAKKAKYVYDHGYAGIGWWDLSLDTYDSRSLLLAADYTNAIVWSGGGDGTWGDGTDWDGGAPPTSTQDALFGTNSASPFTTVLDTSRTVHGLIVFNPPAGISIGGQKLTLGGGGIDMRCSTKNVVVNNPVGLAAAQIWCIADSRTLTVNGVVSGTGALTTVGLGDLGIINLSATNTYTGTTAVRGGTLRLSGGANRIKSGNDIVVDGGTWT